MTVAPPSGVGIDRLEGKPRERQVDLPVRKPACGLERRRASRLLVARHLGPGGRRVEIRKALKNVAPTLRGLRILDALRERTDVEEGDADLPAALREAEPAKRRQELRQHGDPGARGRTIDPLPDRERAVVEHGARRDVGNEQPGADERDAPRPVPEDQGQHECRERDTGEERVENEEPVERVAMPRHRRPEHDPEGRDPVEEDVGGDPDRRENPERRQARPSREDPRDRASARARNGRTRNECVQLRWSRR